LKTNSSSAVLDNPRRQQNGLCKKSFAQSLVFCAKSAPLPQYFPSSGSGTCDNHFFVSSAVCFHVKTGAPSTLDMSAPSIQALGVSAQDEVMGRGPVSAEKLVEEKYMVYDKFAMMTSEDEAHEFFAECFPLIMRCAVDVDKAMGRHGPAKTKNADDISVLILYHHMTRNLNQYLRFFAIRESFKLLDSATYALWWAAQQLRARRSPHASADVLMMVLRLFPLLSDKIKAPGFYLEEPLKRKFWMRTLDHNTRTIMCLKLQLRYDLGAIMTASVPDLGPELRCILHYTCRHHGHSPNAFWPGIPKMWGAPATLAGLRLMSDADLVVTLKLMFAQDPSRFFAPPRNPQGFVHRCAYCHAIEPTPGDFAACSICKVVKYCSLECQKGHWYVGKNDGHKFQCAEIVSTRQEMAMHANDLHPHLSSNYWGAEFDLGDIDGFEDEDTTCWERPTHKDKLASTPNDNGTETTSRVSSESAPPNSGNHAKKHNRRKQKRDTGR